MGQRSKQTFLKKKKKKALTNEHEYIFDDGEKVGKDQFQQQKVGEDYTLSLRQINNNKSDEVLP